ncbi:MBL fold metallo-hydrolase [Pradoshia sp.]
MFKVETSVKESCHAGVDCAYGVVSLPGTKMSVYSFFVDGVLIDTGSPLLLNDYVPVFMKIPIDQVVLTHYHEDHAGGANWIQKHLDIPIYIHESSVQTCSKPFHYPEYRKLAWGQTDSFKARPLPFFFSSKNETWETIHTPGHTKDHVSFYNHDRKTLFSGDLYVLTRTKVIIAEEDITQTMASLRKVLAYDFEEVYCNHAGYLPNGRKRLSDKLRYLEDMEEKIVRLHKSGMDAASINHELFPKQYPITMVSDGEWDSLHIVTSILKQHTAP